MKSSVVFNFINWLYRWQIVWQDSLLSITFDRFSQASIAAHNRPLKSATELSYIDSMRRLCKIGLEIVQQRTISRPIREHLQRIVEYRDDIQQEEQHLVLHLTDIAKCRSMKEQLEFWNLYLHRSYILSELCRPVLRFRAARWQDELSRTLYSFCLENMANTVEAFLGLQNITTFATQSWAAIHRSLSCALLLSILREPSRNQRVQNLVFKLTAVMSHITMGVDLSEQSTPLTRSIFALQKLNLQSSGTEGSQLGESLGFEPQFEFDDQTMSDLSRASTLEASPHSTEANQSSPYSILNTIMWGPSNLMPSN